MYIENILRAKATSYQGNTVITLNIVLTDYVKFTYFLLSTLFQKPRA